MEGVLNFNIPVSSPVTVPMTAPATVTAKGLVTVPETTVTVPMRVLET